MEKIAFGGGCHWCTEAVFESLKGVTKVEQGWVNSTHPDALTLSEAVIVHFERQKIPLDILIEIHLHTHNATSNHSMRQKYRSAIYTSNEKQKRDVEAIMITKQKLFDQALITKVYPFKNFKLNKEKFLHYYEKNQNKPFCNSYIKPKLALLLKKHSNFLIKSPASLDNHLKTVAKS